VPLPIPDGATSRPENPAWSHFEEPSDGSLYAGEDPVRAQADFGDAHLRKDGPRGPPPEALNMPSEWMEQAKPLLKGGVAGGLAGALYDRYLAGQVRGMIGNFAGNWTDAAGSFIVGLLIRKFWKSPLARDAAMGLFAHELAVAIETNVPQLGGSSGGSSGASTWYNALLAR